MAHHSAARRCLAQLPRPAAAAYDAALLLKRKNTTATVMITSTATGAVVTMLEDGRTA